MIKTNIPSMDSAPTLEVEDLAKSYFFQNHLNQKKVFK